LTPGRASESTLAPDPFSNIDEVAVATPVLFAPLVTPACTWIVTAGSAATATPSVIEDEGVVSGPWLIEGVAVLEAENCLDRDGCAFSIAIGEPFDGGANIGGGLFKVSFVSVFDSLRLELSLTSSSRSITLFLQTSR